MGTVSADCGMKAEYSSERLRLLVLSGSPEEGMDIPPVDLVEEVALPRLNLEK